MTAEACAPAAASTSGSPLRVVHVVPGLAPGGAENQIEYLVTRGSTSAQVVCLYLMGEIGVRMASRGARVDLLGMEGTAKITAPFRLARQLRALRPDVVHVHLLSAQLFGTLGARLAGVPVVVSSEHSIMGDSLEGRPKTPALRAVYRVLERLATHTVAVSATTVERLADWGVDGRRVTLVDNAVDFPALAFDAQARAEAREELGLPPDAQVIGAVGRLDPVKRLEPLLRSVAPLLRQRPAAYLVIAGHGALHAQLAALADELAVAGQVRLLGARRDVPRLLNAFDVLASPSRDETFGIAVVEALANGLPVVYGQCPALDDDGLRPEWAVHMPEGLSAAEEEEALRAALTDALDGRSRHEVPAALSARYGLPTMLAATEGLYARLLASSPRTNKGRRRNGA
ncbi:glycosyltransferase [Motilibacter deserti]|uniref:Glycosyltransferase n=1 Tax=Motilibacter deserti TaxID=2714956 RepID=A0ABX0GRH9_9ACTN|nr:glycosyltransferase [Motilibacter deserti]NHC13467.1 glycosyltransferase [Motilibacter deserti]